jgi:hypothetical protein
MESWLVGSKVPASSVSEIKQRLQQDPNVKLEKELQLENGATILVVSMAEASVRHYQQEFGDRFHIERNRPLSP